MTTLARILPKIIEWAQAHTQAGHIHGLHHWNHVADYGQMLCDRLETQGLSPNRRYETQECLQTMEELTKDNYYVHLL